MMSNRLLNLRSLFRSLSLDSLAARLTLWLAVPNYNKLIRNITVETDEDDLLGGSSCRMVTLFA